MLLRTEGYISIHAAFPGCDDLGHAEEGCSTHNASQVDLRVHVWDCNQQLTRCVKRLGGFVSLLCQYRCCCNSSEVTLAAWPELRANTGAQDHAFSSRPFQRCDECVKADTVKVTVKNPQQNR